MSTIVEFDCDCCRRLEYTQPKHSAALIAYGGGIYRGWQQFARAMGLNKDTLIKRVERPPVLARAGDERETEEPSA